MPLEYTERFKRQYVKLPLAVRLKVDKSIKLLDADFRHPGLRSHPVEGAPGIYEAYVDRKYRLTFARRGNNLILRNIDNHDECLRKP
jgi:mRNA-degrading endonuclease YafQ of YafQ-DinJ toxin-antitoxin module